MQTYIAILRGINVGGNRIIKMDLLESMYKNLGLQDCQTYIQSGNVIFRSQITDSAILTEKISTGISEHFQFDVPVIILKLEELRQIISGNPFLKDQSKDLDFLHVTFLSELPRSIGYQQIGSKTFEPEEFEFNGKSIYLYCPNGYGNSKLTNSFFENRLEVTATTRNWKTVNKLLLLAENVALLKIQANPKNAINE